MRTLPQAGSGGPVRLFVWRSLQVCLILCTTLSTQAGATDLLEILSLAVNNDPAFQAARHRYDAAIEQKPQARARLLPNLSYRYEQTENDQNIKRSQNSVFARGSDSFQTTDQGFRLSQSVFDWERWSRLSQSRATVSRAEAELLDARQDLYLRTAEAYIGVLEQLDQLETVRDEKRALEGHLTVAKAKAGAGVGRTVDADDAEARYLIAVAREIEIESRLADRRYALQVLIGRFPDKLLLLRSDLTLEPPTPPNPADWVSRAAASNPRIIARQFRVEEANKEVSARKGSYYPRLDLVASDGTEDTDGSLFGGGSEIDTTVIALELNIPLYQSGYTKSRVSEARSDLLAARQDLLQAQRENEREVRDAFRRVLGSIAQVDALSSSVAAQERTLNLKEQGVKSGRYNFLELLDAVRDRAFAQRDLTQARYDYALNTLRLKRAAGVLSDADMQIVNAWLVESTRPPADSGDRS